MRRTRFQHGSLQLDKRRRHWIFRWREKMPDGAMVRRGEFVGTLKDLPTRTKALAECEHLRVKVNAESEYGENVTLRAVTEKYKVHKMPQRYATRRAYLNYLENHILPKWGNVPTINIKPFAVEEWLKKLPLASKTKAHIKSLMRRLIECAMFWEFIPARRNPMDLVQVHGATKRERQPLVLTVEQFHRLLQELTEEPFRMMVLTAICLGLRCSELFALKWSDFNWDDLTILVQRSIVVGRVDDVKTKYSRTLVPLDPALAEVLLTWKRKTQFSSDDDWVWASPHVAGKRPYLGWGLQQQKIRPAAKRAGRACRLAHVPPHLPLLAGRNWSPAESAAGAHEARGHHDDHEHLRSRDGRYQARGKPQNCAGRA